MVIEFNEISKCTNQCEIFAEMMIKSKNIKQIVELLLSQALAFMQVTLNEDKKAINALCQKVFKEAIGLEQACSLSDTCKSLELKDRQLKAQLLETALFQLENFVNESVLRLLYQIFMDLSEKPIRKIRDLHRKSPNDPIIDELTADFDSITDRLVQIGIFALAFADNKKIASVVRSSLASLEALEPELVPSILSCNCESHSKILEQHWSEEIEQLETQISKIIDSGAFCKALLDIIEQCLRTNAANFDQNSIVDVVAKSKIFLLHLDMNEDLLNLRADGAVKFCIQDFNLILKECEAAVDYIGKIDAPRIIKRIKILNSTLKKLEEALPKNGTNQSHIDKKSIAKLISSSLGNLVPKGMKNSENLFTSHNIRASTRSILYRTNDFCSGISSNSYVDKERGEDAPKTMFIPGRTSEYSHKSRNINFEITTI
jgi:Serendipity locus alpha protein (SRY-A)